MFKKMPEKMYQLAQQRRPTNGFTMSIIFFLLAVAGTIQLEAQTSGGVLDKTPGVYSATTLVEVNSPASPVNDSLIAIVGVRLIDGLGGPPIDDMVVLIDGIRIVDVGPRSLVKIPENATVYDGQGKTLMPGLIDSHLHSVNDDAFLNVILKRGTTSLRDPGHPFRFYQVLDFAKSPAPRAFLTGSHMDGYPGVYKDHALLVKDHAHARETVYDYVRQGSSGIKIYFRLPLEFYAPIVKAAEACHIPVFAHLELVDADDAIRAGIDGIEHVTSFGSALADPADAKEFKDNVRAHSSARSDGRYQLWSRIDLKSDRVREVIKVAVDNDLVFSPTLTTFERQFNDPRAKDYEAKAFKNMLDFVGMAHKAGVRIVTGSHTSGWYADYGWAYQREMELLVEAGLTPMEAIVSSTMSNAAYFRSESRIGSIEKEKLADLLLIDGDPSKNISDMRKISRVMLNGVWVKN
ncbi:MAG: amidohydrolase family protein [Saprospiraceae bacterium]|nr:amidohydrolase family protein [Saprospiraceae bacterium]